MTTHHETPAMNRNYCSYLIRIWREKETAPWRASITHVLTGEIHKFADPQMVFDYLQANWLADSHDAQPFNDN